MQRQAVVSHIPGFPAVARQKRAPLPRVPVGRGCNITRRCCAQKATKQGLRRTARLNTMLRATPSDRISDAACVAACAHAVFFAFPELRGGRTAEASPSQ